MKLPKQVRDQILAQLAQGGKPHLGRPARQSRGPAESTPRAATRRAPGLPAPPMLEARVGPLFCLDVSSTGTGWALFAAGRLALFGLVRPLTTLDSIRRIDATVAGVMALVDGLEPGLVAMEWSEGLTHRRIAKARGLSVVGASQGAVRQALIGSGIAVDTVGENTWTGSQRKATRARNVRLIHPDYAAWAAAGNDPGLDTADAVGIGEWFIANHMGVK